MDEKPRPGPIEAPADFEDAFREHFAPVYRFIARRVGADLAEDLAAEAFATAYRRRASYDPARGSLRSWLFGIAANIMRGHWRDEQQLLELDARLASPRVRSFDDDADSRVVAAALAPRIAGALAALNREQRDVLLLHAWADLSHEEIAAAWESPAGRPGRGCRGPGRRCAPSSASSTSPCGRSRRLAMPDEIDLLRAFRADIPEPDDVAWGRARAAVALAGDAATADPGSRRWPNTTGPEPGWLTCPTAATCYVEGDNSKSPSGPSDMSSFYVSTDGAQAWSVLPVPDGVTFTSALSCASATDCAAGGLYYGHQPIYLTATTGGHSWTARALPGEVGQVLRLDCATPTTCRGLASVSGKSISPGFGGLMPDIRFVVAADGGRRFTVASFPPGRVDPERELPDAFPLRGGRLVHQARRGEGVGLTMLDRVIRWTQGPGGNGCGRRSTAQLRTIRRHDRGTRTRCTWNCWR